MCFLLVSGRPVTRCWFTDCEIHVLRITFLVCGGKYHWLIVLRTTYSSMSIFYIALLCLAYISFRGQRLNLKGEIHTHFWYFLVVIY